MCITRLFVFIQLYDCRKKHLRNEKERERWMQIDYRYMTEESDMDEDKVGQYKLPWRSNSNVICYYIYLVIDYHIAQNFDGG